MQQLRRPLMVAALLAALVSWSVWQLSAGDDAAGVSQGSRADEGDTKDHTHDAAVLLPGSEDPRDAPSLQASDARRTADDVRGGRIHGVMVDAETGAGIAAGVVQLVRRTTLEEDEETQRLVTGSGGRFVAKGLSAGTWLLVPLHLEYAHPFTTGLYRGFHSLLDPWRKTSETAWAQARAMGLVVELGEAESSPFDVELVLRRGVRLTGRVLRSDATPVAGASVHMRVGSASVIPSLSDDLARALGHQPLARTDVEGRFEIHCFAEGLDGIQLGAREKTLIGRWSQPLGIASGTDVELRLYQPAAIEGRVVWEDGRPAEGARVTATLPDGWMGLPRESYDATTADSAGAFRFAVVPLGSLRLSVRPADYARSGTSTELTDLREGERRTDVVVELVAKPLLSGVLVSAEEEPLQGEWIYAYVAGDDGGDIDAGYTDEEGRFVLELPDGGPVDLWLKTADRSELLLEGVRAGTDLRIVSHATPSLQLKVRARKPGGESIAHFTVRWGTVSGGFEDDEYSTDGTAALTLRGSPPYWVSVGDPHDPHGVSIPLAWTGVFPLAAGTRTLEVQLGTRPTFFGRVVNQKGVPVPDGKLVFVDGDRLRTEAVNADGWFVFETGSPETEFLEYEELRLPAGHRDATYDTELEAGTFAELRVVTGGVPLHGRVILEGPGDVSMEGLPIRLVWDSEDDEVSDAWCVADAGGRFVCHALPAGVRVRAVCWRGDLAAKGLVPLEGAKRVEGTAEVGAGALVLRARLGLSVEGRVVGPGVADLEDGRVQLWVIRNEQEEWHHKQRPPSASSPTFRVDGLSPGRYTLALVETSGDRVWLGWVEDIEAGSKGHEIHLPKLTGTISGVLDLTGVSPGAGIEVTVVRTTGPAWKRYPEVRGGAFRLERLDPRARFTVGVSVAHEEGSFVALATDVAPGPGLDLKLAPGLTVTGHVKLDGQAPRLLLVERGRLWSFTRVEDSGAFEITSLVAGTYTVTAVDPSGKPLGPPRTVRAGARNVVLDFK